MYLLAHDVGTTGNKTCLFKLADRLELVGAFLEEYPLYTLPNGGVEQNPDDWWAAIIKATRTVLQLSSIDPQAIQSMAFCAQMQGFVPVDKDGVALRRAMSYMDNRSTAQIRAGLYHGWPRISGWNAYKTLRSLQVTGGLSVSVKDPVWKYLWMRDNEPDLFARLYKWLDVKDYLVLRATGAYNMTYDSANATFMFDTRPGQLGWHAEICRLFGVNIDHLPPVIAATDVAGCLTENAAKELGLAAGTPVFGGGGDLSMISVGAGCFEQNAIHVYTGTSGWVVATVDRRMTDINALVASILGAIPGWYNYISEQETAGRCLSWVRDHLALDEIGVYLDSVDGKRYSEKVEQLRSLYEFLNREVEKVPPGSNGVIFTPWLHGNRSPFEDPNARGIFFNIGLETGKREMIRAVLEGVAYHQRWMLETVEKKIPRQNALRFVGGGAQSAVWAQILSDVTGREIEVIENAQNAGAVGAAIVCAVGLGKTDFQHARQLIRVVQRFLPQPKNQAIYERNYHVFCQLYRQNRNLFRRLNSE